MADALSYRAGGSSSAHRYTTRATLLRRLGDMDESAWREFYEKYRSMIYAIGAKHHLSGPDLEDLMQSVIAVCCESLRDFVYDPEHCRFRNFLYKVIKNVSRNIRRQDRRARRAANIVPAACEPDIDREFMLEYRNFLLRHAVKRLKHLVSSETFMIFEMLEIDERPVAEVALLTNRSANALYVTRHRCLKKLREIIDEMQTELETPPETASPSAPRTAPRS